MLQWNRTFLDFFAKSGRAYNDAEKYGVKILTEIGAKYVVIGVHHLTGAENAGNHHVYCDVLDEHGQRIHNALVGILQRGVGQFFVRVDKPANEPGCNHVLHSNVSNNTVFVSAQGELSERVDGLKSDHPDEESGNTIGHHSFYVVWQRRDTAQPAPLPAPLPAPDNDLLRDILLTQKSHTAAFARIEQMLINKNTISPAAAQNHLSELQQVTENFEKLIRAA